MGAVAGVVVMAAGLVAGWLCLQYIPSWYQPASVALSDLPRIRASVPQAYQAFTDRLAGGGQFRFTLEARVINEWIEAREALWPDARFELPAGVNDPVVAFEDGWIIVAARVARGGLQTIAAVRVSVVPGDERIEAQVSGVTAGALPVMRRVMARALDGPLQKLRRRLRSARGARGEVRRVAEQLSSADALFEGVSVENRFYWANGERYFRILDVEAAGGALTLSVKVVR